jgi:hypothetical protein
MMRGIRLALVLVSLGIAPAVSGGQWRIDPTPLLDIGTADGADEFLFKRPFATRLRDGRIVVADQYAADLRIFAADGKFISRVGRKGPGPGEFQNPIWVGQGRGDSLYVYDYGEVTGVLSVFGPALRFVRAARVKSSDIGSPKPLRLLPDGSILMWGSHRVSYPATKPRPYRGQVGVMRVSPPDRIAVIGYYPGQIIEARGVPRPPWVYVDGRRAVSDSLIFIGDGLTTEVRAYGLDGKLRAQATAPIPPRPYTGADAEAWRKGMRQNAEDGDAERKASIERQIQETAFPKYFPPTGTWMTDAVGNLWVRPYVTVAGRNDVIVMNPALKEIARVALPAGLIVQEIGADHVLGIWHDQDGVPHVRMHRLRK